MPFSASSYKCSSQLFMDWLHAISTTLSPSSCHPITQHQTFSMHPPTIVNQSRNRCIGQDPILKLNMSSECHVLVCNIAFGTLSAPFLCNFFFMSLATRANPHVGSVSSLILSRFLLIHDCCCHCVTCR